MRSLLLALSACAPDKVAESLPNDTGSAPAESGETDPPEHSDETEEPETGGGQTLAESLVPAGPFPGYAVLGNGQIAAVYSTEDGTEDPPGVLHLYAGDHGTDLLEIGQTLVGQGGARVTGWRSGLDPFFAAYAELELPDGASLAWRTFAAAGEPALIMEGALVASDATTSAEVAPLLQLREDPHQDGELSWAGLDQEGELLVAELSDGRALVLGLSPEPESWELGQVVADPVDGGLRDLEGEGRQMALAVTLTAEAGEERAFRQVIALGEDREEALARAEHLLAAEDPLAQAAETWADLAPETLCSGERCAIASANLAAAAASALGGAVPADMTGQFVTNERPQLYPRDAAMVARALLTVGRADEAREIVDYWLDPDIEGPAEGEWYARYDALGRGVDAGTGAAYDTPEWDFNAYLALLVEALGPESFEDAAQERVLAGLDFLVEQQDADGLWTEGGIVEWEGRLASTTMIAWAGLDAGARLAEGWGDDGRAAEYRAAAGRTRGGLLLLVDEEQPMLSSERDGVMSWDTSLLFGPALGYPLDPLLDHSWSWLMEEARGDSGGVRYFEDPSGGTGSYGQDLFFFTTAAAARYGLWTGQEEGDELMDWMGSMTNAYGLAPERVYSDGTGASIASPLSWCAAELGLTILAEEQLLTGPAADGEIDGAEYRQAGWSALDHDGEPDAAGDMVALYAVEDSDALHVGLRLASSGEAAEGAYTLWISGEDGLGPWTVGDGGEALSFRADPTETPGAVAALRVEPESWSCAITLATGEERGCSAMALGEHGIELSVGTDGLTGPLQIIAERVGATLLPASGSLSTAGPADTVLVRFEVDASALGDLGEASVTLSGDRAELGAWAGDALGLEDQGDGSWALTVAVERGGWIAYKYLLGSPGDGSWAGVEFEGDNRELRVDDLDGSGRVVVREVFGERGGEVVDP